MQPITAGKALDYVMPRLSQAADHSLLWLGLAAGLAATRRKWARRAALRGVASVAIASTASNIGRSLARRTPPEHTIPAARRLAQLRSAELRSGQPGPAGLPRAAVVPSRHAASAAAFATGVALELPPLALPVGALAAAVGASRVVAGRRYPADVVAGFVTGVAAGTLTLRWWPRRQMEPAEAARPRHEAPAAPTGKGLVLVMNSASGTTSDALAETLRAELPDARIVAAEGSELPELLREAAATAEILGVAGGDGSVQLAAGLAVQHGLPLLVVPAGTFNHFATDLGVRTQADALAALRSGDSVEVDVARAGQQAFVNTASTGIYVDLVRARQSLEDRLGKWPAVLVALVQVLRSSQPLELIVDGRRRRLWLLFIGNCRYEPRGAAPSYRPDLADGLLDVRLIDGRHPFARSRLIAAVTMGTLARSRVYRTWTAKSIRIAAPDGTPLLLSADGEAMETEPFLLIRKSSRRLLVYRPGED